MKAWVIIIVLLFALKLIQSNLCLLVEVVGQVKTIAVGCYSQMVWWIIVVVAVNLNLVNNLKITLEVRHNPREEIIGRIRFVNVKKLRNCILQ